MPSFDSSARAFTLGAVSGLRSFGALAPLGARGRLGGRVGRFAFPALLAGEIVGDKLPAVPPRSDPPALAGRVATGAVAGVTVAGATGASLGAAGAAATTYLSERARAAIGQRTGVPDPLLGAVEDVLVVVIATAASRPAAPAADIASEPTDLASAHEPTDAAHEPTDLTSEPAGLASEPTDLATEPIGLTTEPTDPEPPRPSPVAAAARGLVASAVGTAAMTTVQVAYGKATGESGSDAPEQVGRRIIHGVLGRRVPRKQRPALNQGMHFLYGTSWGAPFGLAARFRSGRTSPAWGLALGAAVWAVGLAELPALDVAPPPWEQSPLALVTDLAFHLVYGAATGAAYNALGG